MTFSTMFALLVALAAMGLVALQPRQSPLRDRGGEPIGLRLKSRFRLCRSARRK